MSLNSSYIILQNWVIFDIIFYFTSAKWGVFIRCLYVANLSCILDKVEKGRTKWLYIYI